MRIIFAGTPDIAQEVLEALYKQHEVVAVLSQMDRKKGRSQTVQASPVSAFARKHNIPLFQAKTLKGNDALAQTLADFNADVMVVVAYGLILPEAFLSLTKLGCYNGHVSLLPKWRGAAPIQHAILAGDCETGVSIMQLDVGMDTGPVLLQRSYPLSPKHTSQMVFADLARLTASTMLEALDLAQKGQLIPQAQQHDKATYAPKIEKHDGFLDFRQSAWRLDRQLKAFDPWPGSFACYHGQTIKLFGSSVIDTDTQGQPGKIVQLNKDYLQVQANPGMIAFSHIQVPGAKRMDMASFLNGRGDFFSIGDSFDTEYSRN